MRERRWELPARTLNRRRLGSLAVGATAALGLHLDMAAKKKKKSSPKLAARCQAAPTPTLAGSARYAQTFTPSRGGTLCEVRVLVAKQEGQPAGNWIVQVVPVIGDAPSHLGISVIAATRIDDADVPFGASTLAAKFAGTAIAAGSSYALVVSREGGGVWMPANINNPCGGNAFYASDTSQFFKFDVYDLVYSVFVV